MSLGCPHASQTRSQNRAYGFESVKLDALFEVLDAVAWRPSPSAKDVFQFANIDPRTAGKILKNARLIGLVETPDDETFVLAAPYPYKGSLLQKESVVREALLRLPPDTAHQTVSRVRK